MQSPVRILNFPSVCSTSRYSNSVSAGAFLKHRHSESFSQTSKWKLLQMLRVPRLCARAMDASLGGRAEEFPESVTVFPRIYVRDPYKRLGISRDASEEEIQEARNFLVDQYVAHERSREAIEAAYDKIILESFHQRKRSKINLKSSLKKKVEESPPWVRKILNVFETPTTQVVLQRATFFILLGAWSVMNSAEGGPAFQVAVSLVGCIYLLYNRLKSIGRACILGFGALVVGWIFGSFLVPLLPSSMFPRSWSLELVTALISYIFLWFSCTFLK